MTLFGCLWFILLMVCFLSTDIQYLIFLTIISSTFQCSAIVYFGGNSIGPQIITSLVFVVRILLVKRKVIIRLDKQKVQLIVFVTMLFGAIILSAVKNSTIGKTYISILQLLIYILCFLAMYNSGEKISDDYLYNLLKKITIFLLVIGVIQVLITTNIVPRLSIIQTLFYNEAESNNVVYYSRNHYFRIFSTYMEPSYYACFLIGAFYYFLAYKEKRKENRWLLGVMLLEIILTFSSTAYGAFLITGLCFLGFSKESKMKILILVGGSLGFLIAYYGFYDVLDTVIFSKGKSGSGQARFYYNLGAINAYESSKLFGIGYKMTRASSIFYNLLAGTGAIGLVTYLLFNLLIIGYAFSKKYNYKLDKEGIGLGFAIISVVCCQLIAVPDLDICAYWMWLNCFALYLGKQQKVKRSLKTLGETL